MSSIESPSQSESDDHAYSRASLRRSCLIVKSEEKHKPETETDDESGLESGEIVSSDNDRSSDEDYSLVSKKPKKKKKVKIRVVRDREAEKLKKQIKKLGNFAPSFDDVVRAQFQQHDLKYVNFEQEEENFESEDEDEQCTSNQQQLEDEQPEPEEPESDPEPAFVTKKRRIIIYPWRPIGITGGRFPVNDVRALNDIDPYAHSDDEDEQNEANDKPES